MKIGLIGTGLMGQALAQHLLAENQSLIVYNRSSEKTEELASLGAEVAMSAQQVLEQSNLCLLFLSDAEAIHTVFDGIAPAAFQDTLIIQMGTIAPDESRELASRVNNMKGAYLECPVLGSLPEARSDAAADAAPAAGDDGHLVFEPHSVDPSLLTPLDDGGIQAAARDRVNRPPGEVMYECLCQAVRGGTPWLLSKQPGRSTPNVTDCNDQEFSPCVPDDEGHAKRRDRMGR